MKNRLKLLIPIVSIAFLFSVFLIYTGVYYHADSSALAALSSDDVVSVSKADYGWFFDGPSEENILVFYPGAKVEETAYAPMLHVLARQGMDVCLVKMPFRLAFLSVDKASEVLEEKKYENCYVGGHSLGGAMAANFAAKNGDRLSGVILFAAYPTKPLNDSLMLLSIYGSNDGILNMTKVSEGRQYAPDRYSEKVIQGGNHAQFGSYGEQKGDQTALISREEQQKQAVEVIIQEIQ